MIGIRVDADEVAEVIVFEGPELGGGQAGVRRTNHKFGAYEFVRENLEVMKGKVQRPGESISALGKLKGAPRISWDGHRELAIVILGETLESQTRLMQVIDALDSPGFLLGLVQSRKEKRGEDSDDGNNAEELDQSECSQPVKLPDPHTLDFSGSMADADSISCEKGNDLCDFLRDFHAKCVTATPLHLN